MTDLLLTVKTKGDIDKVCVIQPDKFNTTFRFKRTHSKFILLSRATKYNEKRVKYLGYNSIHNLYARRSLLLRSPERFG